MSADPFDGYKVYGPYPDRREGREMVTLVSPTHRTTTPYPRYLMAMRLGRRLRPDEHVDHIDNDPSNNALENLQILTPAENFRKDKEVPSVQLTCASCGGPFFRKPWQINASAKAKLPPCCSRSCSARYQMLNRSSNPP